MTSMRKLKATKKKRNHLNNPSFKRKKPYISRNKAIRKLQVSLKDFRRLCILKGIYPQVPKSKKYRNQKIYYFRRDINLIASEPILDSYRQLKTYLKRKKKIIAKNNKFDYKKLKASKPKISYDHLVKERYPTFDAALSDLSDPLSLMHLFQTVASKTIKGFGVDKSKEIRNLCEQFKYIVAETRSLEKVFVSVKGFYFQADIQGKSVYWMIPHHFNSSLPTQVDYVCLVTFLSFYQSLIKFVNFKLFKDATIEYPPKSSVRLSEKKIKKIKKHDNVSGEKKQVNEEDNKSKKENQTFSNDKKIFEGLTFLLMKETPHQILAFIIKSFGGKSYIETDLSSTKLSELESQLTHKIVDRPLPQNATDSEEKKIKTYETVQPQWIFDSVNEKILLSVDRYAQGKVCPDHLSPFVDTAAEGYTTNEESYRAELKNSSTGSSLVNDVVNDEGKKNNSKTRDQKAKMLGKIIMKGKSKREYNLMKRRQENKQVKIDNLKRKKSKIDHKNQKK